MIKKYNFIVLILILLIIPNIHSAINITILQKPTLSLELVEGGSLTENTRYYFSGYNHLGSTQHSDSVSPAADQVYIDTNTTHKSIKITWGEIPSPATEMAIKWDTIPLVDENGEFIPDRKTSNLKYLTAPSVGFTGTETIMTDEILVGSIGAWSHLELSVPIEETDPKINRKKGICYIEVTETHTYEEFVTAIQNSDANDLVLINRDNMILPCSIYGSGKIEFNKKNITFLYSISKNSEIEFNNSQIHFISPKQTININFKLNESTILPSDTSIASIALSGYFGKNNIIYFSDFAFNLQTYTSLSDLILTNNRINFRYPQDNWYFNNSIINNGHIYQSPTISQNNADIYYINTIWNNKNTAQTYDLIIGDTSYYKNKSEDFYQNVYLINSNSDRPDRLPIIRFADFDNSSNLIDIKVFVLQTLSFQILDQNGDPLENATISITDNNNTNYLLTTNSLGVIDQNTQTHLIKYKSILEGGGDNRTEIIDLNPFTIVINKEGYETYTTTQTIKEKEEFVINLPESSLKIGSVQKEGLDIKGFSGVVDEIRIADNIRSSKTIKAEYLNQVNPNQFYNIQLKETAPTSSLFAWVKIPELSSTKDTPIYMYFGNPLANETNDKETWDDDFVMVQHLNESPNNNEIDGHKDSTKNNKHGIAKGFDNIYSTTNIQGKIGGANKHKIILDGSYPSLASSNYVEFGTIHNNDWNYQTISVWINRTGETNGGYALIFGDARYANFGRFLVNGTLLVQNQSSGNSFTTNRVPANEFAHVVYKYNIDENKEYIFVNGQKQEKERNINISLNEHPLRLGYADSFAFSGIIDEFKVSSIARSDFWIKTEYNNQVDPQSFINIGQLEKS
jgi:hypothetical protein